MAGSSSRYACLLANSGQSRAGRPIFRPCGPPTRDAALTQRLVTTGRKPGENRDLTLFRGLAVPNNDGFLLSSSCPDLANGVQVWPAVSILGQFWPVLANLVQLAPNGVLAVLPSRQVLGRKSGKIFVPRRVRAFAIVARAEGWVEARDPRATTWARFAQTPGWTPTCASRRRASSWPPARYAGGRFKLSKNKSGLFPVQFTTCFHLPLDWVRRD
jgi:hypothetical protein